MIKENQRKDRLSVLKSDRLNAWLETLRRAALVCLTTICWVSVAPVTPQDLLQEEDLEYFERLSRAFGNAYRQVAPGVVLINTEYYNEQGRRTLPRFHQDRPDRGIGSGTIVQSDGYILSNFHVIQKADLIYVTLADRRIFTAEVVGYDSLIDIALLKIPATDLPAVTLGDSDALQIGDWVLAIGHPLDMGSTLTQGIVSALGRNADVFRDRSYSIEDFIQTDAVINPGNSGGPLLNLRGQVIGINTAIRTRTGYYIGYGLAVPITLASKAMRDIIRFGHVKRGYLGISMTSISSDSVAQRKVDLDLSKGVFISEVVKDGPADRSGLRVRDILLEIENMPVDRSNQVQTLVYGKNPGDTVHMKILRGNTVLHLQTILGEREKDQLLAQGRKRLSLLGMEVEPLNAALATQVGFTKDIAAKLGFADGEEVLVVVSVDPDGPAAADSIQVHDVIIEVDQERITSFSNFVGFISQLEKGKAALFWLWRQDGGIDVRALRIPNIPEQKADSQ
jgi:serine protease Do